MNFFSEDKLASSITIALPKFVKQSYNTQYDVRNKNPNGNNFSFKIKAMIFVKDKSNHKPNKPNGAETLRHQ